MSCASCGAPLEAGARFCVGCGSRQPEAVVPQAAVRPFAKTIFQGSGTSAPVVAPAPAAAPTIAAPVASPIAAPTVAAPIAAPTVAAPAPGSSESDLDQLAGRILNQRYRVEQKIGQGGFGAVYRAKQIQMNRTVALKVLHSSMASDAQVVGRFRREAEACSRLRAPHTVQVYDFDQTPEGVLYLAMELLEGKSLHQHLSEAAPLQVRRALRVIDGIAESLAEAHAAGIIHRDIKPENVYLESRPTPDFVKVLDFGIAKIISGDGLSNPTGPALTAAGQTLGTLEYMSPEQLMGGQLDGRSDLYALGVLSYELLTGSLPFNASSAAEIIGAHLRKVPPPPSKVMPLRGISPQVDKMVARLLEKNRERRYRDAGELRADLAHALAVDPGEFATPSAGAMRVAATVMLERPPEVAQATAPAPQATAAPVSEIARPPDPVRETEQVEHARPRSTWARLLPLLIVAAAALLVAAAWWLTRK